MNTHIPLEPLTTTCKYYITKQKKSLHLNPIERIYIHIEAAPNNQ
jgi:hypothetical protein